MKTQLKTPIYTAYIYIMNFKILKLYLFYILFIYDFK